MAGSGRGAAGRVRELRPGLASSQGDAGSPSVRRAPSVGQRESGLLEAGAVSKGDLKQEE